jgi:hypothetical protein
MPAWLALAGAIFWACFLCAHWMSGFVRQIRDEYHHMLCVHLCQIPPLGPLAFRAPSAHRS